MASFWDDLAKTIRDGVETVVEKTEELTRIGKIKVEILNINRNIEKQFANLGGTVYHLLEDNKTKIAGNADVKAAVEKIKNLEKELAVKNEELEKVKSKKEETKDTEVKEATLEKKAEETEAA